MRLSVIDSANPALPAVHNYQNLLQNVTNYVMNEKLICATWKKSVNPWYFQNFSKMNYT
jgi:hypothetical protein